MIYIPNCNGSYLSKDKIYVGGSEIRAFHACLELGKDKPITLKVLTDTYVLIWWRTVLVSY